jgi:hypothetical protein
MEAFRARARPQFTSQHSYRDLFVATPDGPWHDPAPFCCSGQLTTHAGRNLRDATKLSLVDRVIRRP